MCLLLYLYSTCQTLNKHIFLDWIARSGVYSLECWSQEKGTCSVWRALNLFYSTTVRISIQEKDLTSFSRNKCLWQQLTGQRRYNRPSRISPSFLCSLYTKLCQRVAKRQKMRCCKTFGVCVSGFCCEEWSWFNCRITVVVICQEGKVFKRAIELTKKQTKYCLFLAVFY